MAAFKRDIDRAAEILKAIAHPLRLRILALLCAHDESVGAMATLLGAGQPAISQALSILRRERLVAVIRRNRTATYRIVEPALRQLIPWMLLTRRSLNPDERRLRHEPSAREGSAGQDALARAAG